jgi:hypothetical protein
MSITHVYGRLLALALEKAGWKRKRRGMLHRGVGCRAVETVSVPAADKWPG